MRQLQLSQIPPFGIAAAANRGTVRLVLTTQMGDQIGADLCEDAAMALRIQLNSALDAIGAGAAKEKRHAVRKRS